MAESRGRGEGGDWLQRDMKKLVSVAKVQHPILVAVACLYTLVKTHWTTHFTCVNFITALVSQNYQKHREKVFWAHWRHSLTPGCNAFLWGTEQLVNFKYYSDCLPQYLILHQLWERKRGNGDWEVIILLKLMKCLQKRIFKCLFAAHSDCTQARMLVHAYNFP